MPSKYTADSLEIRINDGSRWYTPEKFPYKVVHWSSSATAAFDRRTGKRVPDSCKTICWCTSREEAERQLRDLSL